MSQSDKARFKTRAKQLDLIQIEVDHTTFLLSQYQVSFYSDEQDNPEMSTRFYNEYELDKLSGDTKQQHFIGLIDDFQLSTTIQYIKFAKELLHTGFADVIEFVENIIGDD